LGGAVKSYVGVDQDSKSLEVAENNAVADSIKFVNGSVLDIIRGRLSFQDFDFVYAAGLFDYLSPDLAKRLLCKCLEFLNPGGRLLIGNFAPDNHGRGYMECFMDWKLICRAEADLNELGVAIPETKVADSKIYRDPEGNVVYLDIQRT
jgi:SAM-dependent methyltransferase